MFSLVYASSAAAPFSDSQLQALLMQSRENNARAQITGLLLYRDGNFIQLIEGEEAAVLALEQKIRADPRHRGVLVLLRETIETRQFEGWSMGFRNLSSLEIRTTEGYDEILNYDFTGREFRDNPSLAQKLLLHFKKLG